MIIDQDLIFDKDNPRAYLERMEATTIGNAPISNLTIVITRTYTVIFDRMEIKWPDSGRVTCEIP